MKRRWMAVGIGVALAGAGTIGFIANADEAVLDENAAIEAADPSTTMRLRVGLAERRLYVEIDGQPVDTIQVTVGTDRHPTPTGEFRIARVIWNPSWHPPEAGWARGRSATPPGDPRNPMGRAKLFFREPDYYLHGTNDERTIGYRGSHGCIRMRNDDIIEIARLAMLHGGEHREPNWFRRVINSIRDTEEVRLENPIPITVTEGTPPTPIGEDMTAR